VTGQGIDQFKQALTEAASRIAEKDQSQYFRLPIDRSFVMRGFGTVVTGTLLAGSVVPEQEVEAYPGGQRLRIRGVQVHGQPASKATAGQRTALNITGAEQAELRRGMMLADPGRFRVTREVDCTFELLAAAKPLKHGAPVHFHAGTAETLAHVYTLESTEGVKPGTRSFVRFVLSEPLLLLPGDRFIVRMFSPVVTIGGGVVLDIDRPRRLRRQQAVDRLTTLAEGGLPQRVALLVKESAFGMSLQDLVARTGARAEAIEKAVSNRITAIREPQPWFVNPDWIRSTVQRWRSLLAAFHRGNPLAPGMPREELRSRELPDAPPFLFETLLAADKEIVRSGEVLRLATHKLALKQDEEEALSRIETAFERGGLAVPSMQEVLAASGVEPGRARSLLQILLRERKLVKIGDELVYHQSALNTLKSLLAPKKGQHFGVPEFKEWTGVSRKYAIPLLEHLDRERITRREGDSRVIL
ncbi:MAG: SelB C-terminal domain-containing protein, partial [Bryobacteraceae bacterium]